MGMLKKENTEIKGYLKYRPDGLYAIIFNKSQSRKLGEILLTKDFNKMFDFLGLKAEQKYKGFDSLKEIYDWIISCKFFKPQIFFLENLNQSDRKRNKKRPTFNKFLEYIKDLQFDKNLTNNISPNLIDESFPEVNFLKQINELKLKDKENLELKTKFNGRLVMEWTGLKGVELGKAITEFKKIANDKWFEENSADEIKINFKVWFNLYFKEV
jgi:hypothetical protein